jgi:hypothetical protein
MKNCVISNPKSLGLATYVDPSIVDKFTKENYVVEGKMVSSRVIVPSYIRFLIEKFNG